MIFMDKNKRAVSGLLRKKFRTAFITAAFIEFIQIVALTIDSGIVCMLLGKNELAAVGIASPFFFLCGIPAVCLSAGLQTLCSQELGKGDTEKANKYFSATVIFSVIMVSVLTAALFIAAPHLAFLFGARGNAAGLLELFTVYLKNLAFDAAPFIMLSVLTPVLVLDNDSRTVLASSIAGGITNIAFDILSTKMGWGLCGIGLASAASASVSLLIALTHFLRKDNVIKSRPSEADLRSITEVIRCGLPNAIHSGSGFVRSLVLNSLVVAVGGCAGMSVLTIHSNIIDFADIIAVGIAGAVGVMSGIAFGEMNGEEMEDIGTLAVRYICTVSAVGLSVFLMFSSKAAAFIAGGQTDIRPLLMFALICIGSEIFFNAVIYYRVSYLQAVNENKNAQNLEASANLVFLLMFAFLFSVMFGAYGVFAAFPVSKAAAMAVIYLIYKKRAAEIFLRSEIISVLTNLSSLLPKTIFPIPLMAMRKVH
ncbi:MAG: hypothetical protein K6C13_01945 [Oscillospiraceae bacterium]|nr:hypothetical protein [Oscillospiraceae bacterium]